ncbi:MAG: class I SAM-dependent methyltransferase [Verrucomicrobiota bacterium]
MSFDAIAPHYHWMECILAGEKLQRCRTHFLDEVPIPRKILLLGEGHGRCLTECRRRFPDTSLTCVDASAKMLQLARRRLETGGLGERQVEFVHADALEWKPAVNAYDLIITNFFLDCFRADQLERVIARLSAAASSDSNWLIADFQIPPGGLRRIRARLLLWTMYAFFRVVTRLPAKRLTAPDSFLQHAGFRLHRRTETEWSLLYSDWWKREIADSSSKRHRKANRAALRIGIPNSPNYGSDWGFCLSATCSNRSPNLPEL